VFTLTNQAGLESAPDKAQRLVESPLQNDCKASGLAERRMSVLGATRTCRNVRYLVAMGWQADLEEAGRNKLNL
jgi:hypothetical protein